MSDEARIAAFAEHLEAAGSSRPFVGEGLCFSGVPGWIVLTYARARFHRADVLWAMVVECDAEQACAQLYDALQVARCGQVKGTEPNPPQVLVWTLARAWTARLGDLERAVRGVAQPAAVARIGRAA